MPEQDELQHWISGSARAGRSGRTIPVLDPATGAEVTSVPLASAEEVGEAVATAKVAGRAWRATSLGRRADVLYAFRQILREGADELARIISREHGKTHGDALGEIARGAENADYATGIPELLKGSFSEQVSTGVDVHSIRQPLGVVAGITPFNFPAMVPLWMCTTAIACGNAFVLKPSEKVPSAAVVLARMWRDAGLPDGVFSVVHGDKGAVDALIAHPDVAAISFVGSTPVARGIYAAGTAAGKRVQALGGAKNHMVVMPDADVDAAADAAVSAAFGSAGERCMAVSVVVPVGDVAEPLVAAISRRLPALRVGPASDPDTDIGPLISAEHRDRVLGYVDAGVAEGAELVVDGRTGDLPDSGYFVGPCVLDRVERSMSVYRDEIFGPVLSVVRADSYDEALSLVNEHEFGNGAAIFTRSGGAARQFSFDVEAGMVGVNVPVPVPVAHFSFGGWKSSLFGDARIYGPEGVRFYTRDKVVTSRWQRDSTAGMSLHFPSS
ncbi:methylmalonate-semialdehyde dehydrogenase [Beutenbergia cavernae DSM 12333]|uniref:methylmalonate-semialdehyde dehydrogenase (CoA acylating) n=1 Tax=Beutenbergia cavernae (strain ATCC BAA-8 / DSM 12333 / CCUG 43141 / JCM 11478 / NBRC 16432 / NCIMB 13614 / HKI 0122) TaxID=471853 RepID=C5C663_BEUC1|nr:CoA-acylating methylmalonate-semialdehyde dehydrogenase [Beutenbergia cavernae]ACQ82421.1 methylmalonate-semialdehyde dehydrogenase [Beutenbergia cavernae DSM 12333]